eukprot:CAMPEP_0194348970 /NCGR_PEP_ID=MMETSP0171-20130528/106829_1 /TAXON_ID=218684 /ORGANISM="Corethron pennatum, Strain L29A3" /LENGTH=113 /DNA_ID=CAMNT_0039116367 /DNA_START=246 /DNA_END=588 /DNA_ORIENTATION=-
MYSQLRQGEARGRGAILRGQVPEGKDRPGRKERRDGDRERDVSGTAGEKGGDDAIPPLDRREERQWYRRNLRRGGEIVDEQSTEDKDFTHCQTGLADWMCDTLPSRGFILNDG